MMPYDADTERTTRPPSRSSLLWPWDPHTTDAAVTHRETSSTPSHPHDTPLQRFGATLRHYRQQRGLTQPALTASTGIRQRYLSQIEQGRRNIAVLSLLRLAHALEIPAAWLLAGLDPHADLPRPTTADLLPSSGVRDAVVTPGAPPSLKPDDQAPLLPLLGATIRQYRQQRHLSQRALAARTRLAASYICDIEQGQRNVSVLSLLRIAEALELSVAHLLVPLETHQSAAPPFTA